MKIYPLCDYKYKEICCFKPQLKLLAKIRDFRVSTNYNFICVNPSLISTTSLNVIGILRCHLSGFSTNVQKLLISPFLRLLALKSCLMYFYPFIMTFN